MAYDLANAAWDALEEALAAFEAAAAAALCPVMMPRRIDDRGREVELEGPGPKRWRVS